MANFNFYNIFIMIEAGTNVIADDRFRAQLSCCYLNEQNEGYLFIWDDEEKLIQWKTNNLVNDESLINGESLAIDYNLFNNFIVTNTQLQWIFLNPTQEVTDYEEAESKGIDKLMLSSALGMWPFLEFLLLKKSNLTGEFLAACKKWVQDNPSITLDKFWSNIDEISDEISNQVKNEFIENWSSVLTEADKKIEELKLLLLLKFPALYSSLEVKETLYPIVSQLFDDIELVNMGKNFINETPVGFYTNINYLIFVECLIEEKGNQLGRFFYLSSEEQRIFFKKENLHFITKNKLEVTSYVHENIEIFAHVIKERFEDKEIDEIIYFLTYIFIYNIVTEQLANKWENEYKQYFQDIGQLNLDEAIERYCSIEEITHKNDISVGNFIYYLIKHNKFGQDNHNYLVCQTIFNPILNHFLKNKKHHNFINRLKQSSTKNKYTINDVDLMNGQEFENFIAELFSKMGYESKITKASGDQGIDVIASKNGNTIGIQAKCYSSLVSNSAIQEVVAGKNHYRLDKVIVITNNLFTNAAQQLAQSNSVILWDRDILKEKIAENFN